MCMTQGDTKKRKKNYRIRPKRQKLFRFYHRITNKLLQNRIYIYNRTYVPKSTSIGEVSRIGTTALRMLSGLRTT